MCAGNKQPKQQRLATRHTHPRLYLNPDRKPEMSGTVPSRLTLIEDHVAARGQHCSGQAAGAIEGDRAQQPDGLVIQSMFIARQASSPGHKREA